MDRTSEVLLISLGMSHPKIETALLAYRCGLRPVHELRRYSTS